MNDSIKISRLMNFLYGHFLCYLPLPDVLGLLLHVCYFVLEEFLIGRANAVINEIVSRDVAYHM